MPSFHEIVIVLVILYWIARGIYRFFQWVARAVSGTSAAPAGPAPLPARPAAAPAVPMPPRHIPDSPPIAPQQSEPRLNTLPLERTAIPSPAAQNRRNEPLSPVPTPSAISPLFGSSNELVRAFIMSEVLGPPLSQRHSLRKQQ